MEAIILAGGKGTRLQPAVSDVPKPMAPIHGRPFLEYQIDYWIKQGVRRFILSIGYRGEIIQKHFGMRYKNAEIACAVESLPLGTGGGLLLAAQQLKATEPFLILNGDTFFEVDLEALRSFHQQKKSEFTVAVLQVPVNRRYGAVRLGKDSEITTFKDKIPDTGNILVNGGIYLAERSALEKLPWAPAKGLSLEEDLFPYFLKSRRRAFGFVSPGRFLDIGTPEDYRAASAFLAPL